MPFRAELRRPDLKGTFRCSICNKIFCHSSSLSRHRMQAHFKSYTCTLCNKEITSNETLRAHMYKNHQISRMFMCRCCNWAFPDKTSLHIHMQAMATGNPGNVSIIAKSSSSPPMKKAESMDDLEMGHMADHENHSVHLNNASSMSSIFPALASREDLINRLRERAIIGNFVNPPPAGLDLAAFFPNFAKFNPALAMLNFGRPQQANSSNENGFSSEKTMDLEGHCYSPTGSMDGNGLGLNNKDFDDHDEDDEEKLAEGDMLADIEYGDGLHIDFEGGAHTAGDVDASPGEGQRLRDSNSSASSAGPLAAVNNVPDEVKPTIDQLKAMIDGGAGFNGPSTALAMVRKPPTSRKRKSGWSDLLNRAAASNIEATGSPQLLCGSDDASATQILPAQINATPLNSLLYRKKLSAAFRTQRNEKNVSTPIEAPPPPASLLNNLMHQKFPADAAAAFFAAAGSGNLSGLPAPFMPSMTPSDFAAMAASPFFSALQQQLKRGAGVDPIALASTAENFGPNTTPLNLTATNRVKEFQINRHSPQSKFEGRSPMNGGSHYQFGDQQHQRQHLMNQLTAHNAADDGRGHSSSSTSHISPTDSAASTKSSLSLVTSNDKQRTNGGEKCAVSLSPPFSTKNDGFGDRLKFEAAQRHSPTAASSSPPSSPAFFQCQVFKGKLALSENRSRFLESRTTSQESKISRLENRIGTLEANNRRYETEAVALRDHCEILEQKILECQERALRYLSANEYDEDTTKKILHDILETCRVDVDDSRRGTGGTAANNANVAVMNNSANSTILPGCKV